MPRAGAATAAAAVRAWVGLAVLSVGLAGCVYYLNPLCTDLIRGGTLDEEVNAFRALGREG